mmetsp:Transcript_27432/g.40778  ORF Transcript_27432/g.40778 Transcript_27432/m.40778 type:complete len:235 (-) Transcript_27432:1895-2599(-)
MPSVDHGVLDNDAAFRVLCLFMSSRQTGSNHMTKMQISMMMQQQSRHAVWSQSHLSWDIYFLWDLNMEMIRMKILTIKILLCNKENISKADVALWIHLNISNCQWLNKRRHQQVNSVLWIIYAHLLQVVIIWYYGLIAMLKEKILHMKLLGLLVEHWSRELWQKIDPNQRWTMMVTQNAVLQLLILHQHDECTVLASHLSPKKRFKMPSIIFLNQIQPYLGPLMHGRNWICALV